MRGHEGKRMRARGEERVQVRAIRIYSSSVVSVCVQCGRNSEFEWQALATARIRISLFPREYAVNYILASCTIGSAYFWPDPDPDPAIGDH